MVEIYSPLAKSLSRNCGRVRGLLDIGYEVRDEFVDSTLRNILYLNQIYIINTNSPVFVIRLS